MCWWWFNKSVLTKNQMQKLLEQLSSNCEKYFDEIDTDKSNTIEVSELISFIMKWLKEHTKK